ncbi:hypothetical protein THMIRHAS_04260 [Thiosulfatimonas sediminis]|uniref:Type II secretion system protein J n=1 Tax=Thiosulfatimonas sediminis TaxID=2675054 RepID=A0A6F8PSE9_9GAMM|nr:type II secretion system minor pseudopilin GspJ [Thiosulfatimonas sediminis]BBP45053.1 hypothetical protein THMIRHAS_04260 [Thiosulfatimonas sediminis]
MDCKPRIRQQGFTLIELLIAMSIAAVISLMAYQSIDASVRSNQILERHQQDLRQVQSAWWWLEQDLMQLAPRAVSDGLGGTLPALAYRTDIPLEFSRFSVADSPLAQAGRYGVLRVAYLFEGSELIRLQWPVSDRAPDSQPSRRVLLQDVQQFALRFLDQNGQWQSSWPPVNQTPASLNNRLPKALEVSMQTAQGEVRRLFAGVDWLDFNPYTTATSAAENSSDTSSESTPQAPTPEVNATDSIEVSVPPPELLDAN